MDGYRNLVSDAKACLFEKNRADEAQVYAMLAIADRLDRLCEIMSRGGSR